jgi:uncharacterized protein (TIGR02646 family)
MHKLDRTSARRPRCLDKYNYPLHTWDDVTREDKQELRACLQHMQNSLCAYCESPLFEKGHIEHFRRKSSRHFPQYSFVWDNLFLSCDSHEHCGHYKDRHNADPYDPAALVKPDVENPDLFFYFHSSGELRARAGATEDCSSRAEESIRILNLNCPPLKAQRRACVAKYKQSAILEELMRCDEQLRQDYIKNEIEETRHEPYCSVIRHFFERLF